MKRRKTNYYDNLVKNNTVEDYYKEMLEFIENIEKETGVAQVGERRNLEDRFKRDIDALIKDNPVLAYQFVAQWKTGILNKINNY